MTGARYTKHRYYAPRVSSPESLRPDFNERAIAFKQINTILSKQATLNPDTSSNAVPSKENTDGKKRTLSSGKDNAPNYGIIWDKNAKRKPGQYFKHWVTDRERLMASSGLNKEPNYGWVTPKNIDFRTARDKIVKGPQVVITKHKINPKTGKIDKSRDIEVKRLPGKTIAERFPAGKIVNRAASRAGMIVDALGKLRCPPGTPAANQFTDVTGSNCFDVSLSDIGKVIGDLVQAFSMPKASVVDGVDLDSVYAEGSGLRSRSSVSDRVRKIVNRDSGPKRPSEEVLKRARSIANREERMKQAIERRRNAVQVLKDSFGIEGENETLTHFQLLQQLVETGRLNPDFKMDDLLMLPQTNIPVIDGPMYAVNELQRIVEQLVPAALDPNASIEDKLKAHEAVFLHTALLRMGLTDKEALDVVKNYQSGFVDDSTESLRRLATDMWDMQKGYLDGFFELVKNDEKKAKKIILRQAFFDDHTQGDSLPIADSDGNSARLIRYNPLQILGVDRNSVKPLRSDEVLVLSIKEGTEGTDAENAMAIAHEAAQVQSLKEFSRKFGINLAAEEGGFRESGSHLFYHEYSHTLQMDAAEELLRAEGIVTSDFTAEEVSNTVLRLLVKPSVLGINIMPSGNEFADGLDIEELIARKLDILGGAYSYSEQGKIIDFLAQGGSKNSAEFKKLRNIALLETTAEMWANRKRGIISDEEVDDVLEWMDREKPRTSLNFDERSTSLYGPSEPVSVAPDIAEELGIEVPVSPASTPSPAGTSSMSDRIKDGMDIPELEQEVAKIYKKTRSKSKVHKKRKEFIDFFVKNSFGKKSVTELNDKELEILSRALDTRADGFIDDGDDRLSKSFKDMASDIRDLIEIRKERRRQLSPGVEPVVKPETSPITPSTISEALDIPEESIPDSALDIEEPLSDEEWRESLYRNPPSFLQSRTFMAGATGQPSLNSNDRARIQSTINQRKMNAEQYASVADAFSGEAPYIAGSLDIENLSDSLRESAEIRRILTNSALIDKRRQSKSSSGSLMDEQIENYVAPLLSAMDENPTVADFELEIDSSELDGLLSFGGDLAPGTEINHTGFISGNISEEAGLRSMSRRVAGVTGRVLSSERGAQVLGRAGLSEDNIDTVQFGAELASAFLIGGPVGVVGAIARRGSRDAADRALEFARAKGFITPEQASIIESRVLPRLGEGLPPDVLQAIERAATSDAARQGLERARGAAESATRAVRDSDILDEGLDRVRGVAGSARQALSSGDPFAESTDRAREIVGTAREAIKRRASRERASRPGVFESGTAAGWNPDPSKPGQYRYWNGQVWTEHISDPSGNQSIDNNPQLSSQAGWSEYQNGVLSAQSGGSSSDPFGDYSPPSSNQSVYDDPFADMETTPVSSSEWSGAINDPFADFSDPFSYVEQQPEPQQSRSGRIGRLKKGKRNQEQSAPQRDAWDDIFDMSQEQIAEEYG
jgi:hypothetical protein